MGVQKTKSFSLNQYGGSNEQPLKLVWVEVLVLMIIYENLNPRPNHTCNHFYHQNPPDLSIRYSGGVTILLGYCNVSSGLAGGGINYCWMTKWKIGRLLYIRNCLPKGPETTSDDLQHTLYNCLYRTKKYLNML
ncbi:uncharacterized protein LOC134215852 isoform X2 [Armigeres subalbatus]|uniref:uncharacterized protein LOC134215852 isoform X2 n=1 Tax=Armigeres subalbatus TaxID=124917 RepID=UPI002ED100CE